MKRKKRFPWQQALIAAAGLIVLLPIVKKYASLKLQCLHEQRELQEMRKENGYYSELLKQINQPYLVEKLAREQFGLMKKNEYLFRIHGLNKTAK